MLGRNPTTEETALAVEFVKEGLSAPRKLGPWEQHSQVLRFVEGNEFTMVD